ncbi:MAG: T9SS type A sorting domain-containing protein [Bacteroidota bacterium]
MKNTRNLEAYLFSVFLILFGFPILATAQNLYHIAPQGNDSWNGLFHSHQGGNDGPWQTVGKANAELQAGDIVELQAGMYEAQIRPQNSGIDHENRIIYRPFGDGDVIFPICFNGGDNHEQGIIALGNRNYITITGRSIHGDETERLFKLQLTGLCSQYGNMAGSEGCIVENISMEHIGTDYAPNRGFLFADYWWSGIYETKYCVLRNCIIDGYIRDPSDPSKYTEDVVSIAQNAHHLLIENNVIGASSHVSLNLNQATTHSIVIRNNVVANPSHTALSFYGLGEIPTIQQYHLLEGNTLTASLTNASAAFPGNALQYGASETIVRHNIIAEGGHASATTSIGGLSCSMGGFPGQILEMSDNRFYNNTIANNEKTAVGSYFFGGDGVDKGRNKWVNNIIYGSSELLVRYWEGFDDGHDRYISNLFGNPSGNPNEAIINVGFGNEPLSHVIANYSNPHQPDFSPWNGFKNFYHSDPNFVDYGTEYSINDVGPCYDSGSPVTNVDSSDASSGITLQVEDSRYFFSEASEFPAWMGVEQDWIAVGESIADAHIVQVVDVIDSLNRMVLAADIQRTPSDFVWLWKNSQGKVVIQGEAPDIGASENGEIINSNSLVARPDVNIFPNPTDGIIYLQQNSFLQALTEISLYDMWGKKIKKFPPGSDQLNLTEFSEGIYLLSLRTGKEVRLGRIVLIK